MTQTPDAGRDLRLDPDSLAGEYFRDAVAAHWDPNGVTGLAADREKLVGDADLTAAEFEELRTAIARFGAGGTAVTTDLLGLGLVLEDTDDTLFLSSQLYEAARHARFFDRYWREVVDPTAAERGFERTTPSDGRYRNDHYRAIGEQTAAAMRDLRTAATPANRARAYCHYHVAVESVLAQTGYYGIEATFSPAGSDDVAKRAFPHLEGLVTGVRQVRTDEGRHVGFGMQQLRHLVHDRGVSEAVVRETLQDLLPHVAGTVNDFEHAVNPVPLVTDARDRLTRRIDVITDADADLPDVATLVSEVDDTGATAD